MVNVYRVSDPISWRHRGDVPNWSLLPSEIISVVGRGLSKGWNEGTVRGAARQAGQVSSSPRKAIVITAHIATFPKVNSIWLRALMK